MGPLVAAELRKLSTTRLWLWLLLAASALTALYASLLIAFSEDPDTWTLPLTTAAGQRSLLAVASSGARTMAAVLGAIGLAGEFRHRTATATFLATPQRGRVVAAKLVAYGLAGVGYALVCIAVVAVIALPWLSAKGIHVPLTGNGLAATAGGVVVTGAVFGVLGVGLAAVLREQVATVVSLLVYLFVAEPILTGVPALEGWTTYLPGPAAQSLTGLTLTTQHFLEPWQGAALLLGYGLALAATGVRTAVRRDLT